MALELFSLNFGQSQWLEQPFIHLEVAPNPYKLLLKQNSSALKMVVQYFLGRMELDIRMAGVARETIKLK